MTGTDSARNQPPIDTTLECRDGKHADLRVVPGGSKILLCVICGGWVFPRTPLVIAGPDLVSAIKFFAELWQELREIDEWCWYADTSEPLDAALGDNNPTAAELYEAKVAELAHHIGELRIPGGDT